MKALRTVDSTQMFVTTPATATSVMPRQRSSEPSEVSKNASGRHLSTTASDGRWSSSSMSSPSQEPLSRPPTALIKPIAGVSTAGAST